MFEFDWDRDPPLAVKYLLPYSSLENPPSQEESDQKKQISLGYTFSHTLEEQIGGQLLSGFSLRGIYEDRDRGGVVARFMNSYVATKTIKI